MKKDLIRTEIGSEFWDIPLCGEENTLLPANTKWFVSGTSALGYIIDDIGRHRTVKRAGVPSWCCSCMIQPFLDAGMEVVFYPVYPDGERTLTCDYERTAHCDVTLVLSYFGYAQLNTIGQPGGIVIRDLTHSLFGQKYDDGQYCFGSLRKWAGFWTGGYGWKCDGIPMLRPVEPAEPSYLQLRADAMSMKVDYLIGAAERKEYLGLFEEAEDYLDRCGIRGSCERDIRCAGNLDVELIRKRRRENARVLLSRLQDIALFSQIGANDCPMFVPVLLPNREIRDGLRRFLISREIYCPVHWPVSQLHVLGEKEKILYDRSLSLVCDQRYDAADMLRIADAVREYRKSSTEW